MKSELLEQHLLDIYQEAIRQRRWAVAEHLGRFARAFWSSAISPTISGALFAAGWISLPLIACGLPKITYDLTLWRAMRRDRLDGE